MFLLTAEGFLVVCAVVICFLCCENANGMPLINSTTASANSTIDESFEGDLNISEELIPADELFEGDLDISQEMIRRYYDVEKFENITGKKFTFRSREKRGAAVPNSARKLWPDATVYYSYGSGISTDRAHTIRGALERWEDSTCLRFVPRTSESDYVEFVDLGDDSCSSVIGRSGGKQLLRLGADRCYGFVPHEVGHAIGFFHEHVRPDRDSYIRVVESRIKEGKEHNFMKLTTNDINSLGVQYDYDSVMHYGQDFQSNSCYTTWYGRKVCRNTIEISNSNVYASQGRPTLGQLDSLSSKDTQQARLLYNCPRSGVYGRLKVNVRYARNLPDTDPWWGWNLPDPYVKVIGVDSGGSKVYKQTSYSDHTVNPNWNTWLDLGVRNWRYFRIRIWDSDYDADDHMSISESIAVSRGTRTYIKQCINTGCSGYMYFDFRLCPDDYDGPNCNIRRANLRFKIRYGRNLPDSDPWLNDSDPYVKVIAYDHDGQSVTKATHYLEGDHNPDWNKWLYFGKGAWKYFKIRVWDSDYNPDDALSNSETVTITSGSHTSVRHKCRSGYIKYDYYFD